MAFWQIFIVFSSFSIVFVMWPFFRRWRSHKKALRQGIRQDVDEATLLDREDELDTAYRLGDIDESDLEALKKDLAKTRLQEKDLSETQSTSAIGFGSKSQVTLIVAALLIPVIAYVGYWNRGAMPDLEITEQLKALNTAEKPSSEEWEGLISKMQERLEHRPSNDSLWYLLAKLSFDRGMYEESVSAYRALSEIYPEDARVSAEFAQALFFRAGKTITTESRELLKSALSHDPNQTVALSLSGIDQFSSGNFEGAIGFWSRAVRNLDPSSLDSKYFSQAIASARIAAKQQAGSQAAATKDASGDVQSGAEASALRLNVSLGSNVKGLQGNEVLFIYARAWQGAKIPLAIQRMSVSDLPLDISLDSSMAMAKGMDINSASQLEVVARISTSGSASPQSGDWSASYGPIVLKESEQPIQLTINDKIP